MAGNTHWPTAITRLKKARFLAMCIKFITFVPEMKAEGNGIVPFFISQNAVDIIQVIENHVVELISDRPDLFLISVRGDMKNNFKVFVDGDNGITIDACARLNRKLYKIIEVMEGFEDGNFSLEVSSPGLDEPLRQIRQYKKNMGRPVEITLAGGTLKEGVLKDVQEHQLTIEYTTGKGKKMETIVEDIPQAEIKTITVKIII